MNEEPDYTGFALIIIVLSVLTLGAIQWYHRTHPAPLPIDGRVLWHEAHRRAVAEVCP